MSDKVKDSNGNEKKMCFIITPIGSESDPIRRHIDGVIDAAIKPCLEDTFDIKVAHRLFSPTSISKEVILLLHKSDLVIANLTGLNPNVMYELAIRHCEGRPVIIIAEEGTPLPFDVTTERTIFYVNDAKGVLDLKNSLSKCIQNIEFGKKLQGPVYDALRTIGQEEKIIKELVPSGVEDVTSFRFVLNKLEAIDNKINSVNSLKIINNDNTDSMFSHLGEISLFLNYLKTLSISDLNHFYFKLMKEYDDLKNKGVIKLTRKDNQHYNFLRSEIERELKECEQILSKAFSNL